MEHTKEPWGLGVEIFMSAKAGEKFGPAFTYPHGHSQELCEANARRIVACVNYCNGHPTETLEWAVTVGRSSIEHLDVLSSMLRTAESQRDELLTVLEAMLEEVAGCYCTTEAAARAVIQKVRGGE